MTSRPESRRSFLGKCFTVATAIAASELPALALPLPELASGSTIDSTEFKGKTVFYRLVNKATSKNWQTLPMGELIGKLAHELEGTPYVASTLEIYPDREVCSVNMRARAKVVSMKVTQSRPSRLTEHTSRSG